MPKQNLVNLARHSNTIVPVPRIVPLYAADSTPNGTYVPEPDTAHPEGAYLSRQHTALANLTYLLFEDTRYRLNGVFLEDRIVRITNHGTTAFVLNTVKWTPSAHRTITFASVAEDDSVTIGDKVYKFKEALSETPTSYEVLIGADDDNAKSASNLVAAINGASGAGTTYGAGTLAHPSVYASSSDAVVTIMPRYVKDIEDEMVKTGMRIYFTTSNNTRLAKNVSITGNTTTISYQRLLTWSPVITGAIVLAPQSPVDVYLDQYCDFYNGTGGTINISLMILE